jgi:membrane protein implicated in regulation of membrane protease activity
MTEDEIAKKRFHAFLVIRLFGVALFILGTAIAFSDLLRPGGWPLLGAVLAITGVVDAMYASRIVKRASERK